MQTNRTGSRKANGFTLVETLISILILGLVFSGALLTYTRSEQRAEWTGYSLAAQSLCAKTLEQFHAALWDSGSTNYTLTIPLGSTNILDLPVSGTNVVWATNTATVTSYTNSAGPSYYETIQVQTTWVWRGQSFTNTLMTYRAPDI
jgi:prepilin-type N-terminal cleavage/methylation domain-containing protein